MSASYLVDLNSTIIALQGNTGNFYTASGSVISPTLDLIHANSFTHLYVVGLPVYGSGQFRIAVQTSDTDVSGNFTDPTSGLAQFPTIFQSGGVVTLNSGGGTTAVAAPASMVQGGIYGAPTSGQYFFSGFIAFAGFQRPHRFVRSWVLSGDFTYLIGTVGFLGQLKTTGSGGGQSQQPGSGVVNV